MTKLFRKTLSILCVLALLLMCAGAAIANEELTPDLPEDQALLTEGEKSGEDTEEPEDLPEETKEVSDSTPDLNANGSSFAEVTDADFPEPGSEQGEAAEPEGQEKPEGPEEPEEAANTEEGPSEEAPGTTEIVSESITLEEAAEAAEEPESPAAGEPTAEETPMDITPSDGEEDEQGPVQDTPEENEPDNQPEEEPQDDPEINPEDETEEEPQDEPENKPESEAEPEETPDDELKDEPEEEPVEEEEEILLNLNGTKKVSGVVTKGIPFTLKASDDYSRVVVFTLAVPDENAISVIVNDQPVSLEKAENENPEDNDVRYIFEQALLQGQEYSITLKTEKDGYIPFTLSIEKKEEKAEDKKPETSDNPTKEEETSNNTESGLNETENNDLPTERNAVISISWDDENPGYGSVAHFHAELIGYEETRYTLQWQWSSDGSDWTDVENATSENMDIIYSRENGDYSWRILVDILPTA